MSQSQNLFEIFQEMEMEAAETYRIIAQQSEGELAAICEQFAEEELGHAIDFKVMQEEFEENMFHVENDSLIANLLASAPAVVQAEPVETTKALFLKALGAEKNSINLYTELKNMLPAASAMHDFMETLIDMERKHMYTILKILHEQV